MFRTSLIILVAQFELDSRQNGDDHRQHHAHGVAIAVLVLLEGGVVDVVHNGIGLVVGAAGGQQLDQCKALEGVDGGDDQNVQGGGHDGGPLDLPEALEIGGTIHFCGFHDGLVHITQSGNVQHDGLAHRGGEQDQDDAAQSLMDAASYSFGILADLDRENTDTALQQMASETGGEVSTKEYSSLTELADGLLKGDCQAIVLNRAYLDVFDEIDNYASFSSQIREIASEQVEKLVERNTPAPVQTDVQAEDSSDTTQDAAVTDQIYTIFVSGIDTRGDITASSRSDVNIVLTVNARTKQVLMISTPRDYYVPLSISNGVPDKLTHAGIYGINVCMDTLNMLYDTDINYYFRLNFAGFVQIIDALGGITVDSDYDFTTQNSSGYHFTKGPNQVNEQALAFCRERYAFSAGDRQRGKDQMKVIQGVINKATSPDILKNYLSLLDSLSGCFETNIPYDVITSLVKQQLDEGGSWQVLSYSVDGTGDTQKPYSMSQKAYVMVPDQTTVDKAKTLMQKVRQGFMLSEADVSAQ